MKLYKNVDICDLESIMEKGILSLDESGNDNWEDDNRVENRTDVVYLFAPKSKFNSFPKAYGTALIEVEVDNAIVNEMAKNDVNKDNYTEYIIPSISVSEIKKIYIPTIFKENITEYVNDEMPIEYCEIKADYYAGAFPSILKECDNDFLMNFAKTANVIYAKGFNFFRGHFENEVKDIYNVQYILK